MPLKFSSRQTQHLADLRRFVSTELPELVETEATAFFVENFKLQGFLDEGLEPWPQRKAGPGSKSKALLIRTGRLRRGVRPVARGRAGDGFFVRIGNSVPYAELHNEGGTTHPRVTPRMRRWAWAQYYDLAGSSAKLKGKTAGSRQKQNRLNSKAAMYKAIALTKKPTLTVRVPARKFMGNSASLNRRLFNAIQQRIKEIS